MNPVAVIILTKNEEPRIEACLKQFRPHVQFILVVDSESTDKTVEIAKKYAKVIVRPFSGSFAEEKNFARKQVPSTIRWILWADADEVWDKGFLKRLGYWIGKAEIEKSVCFRFPRANLPDGKNWPDYQIRLIRNSKDIVWKGDVHEVPWYIQWNVPLDQADSDVRDKILPITTLYEYAIVHLPRRKDLKRAWW